MEQPRRYIVHQTRQVTVNVVPEKGESYEAAAMRIAESAFENPGDPEQGMNLGVHGMPRISEVRVVRSI